MTLKVKEPPNPEPWEEQFVSNQFKITCAWDLEFFKKHEFKKPKFLTLGIQSKSGLELARKDFLIESEPQYVNLENNQYSLVINTFDKPSRIVMYLFDEDKKWSERYEKDL